MINTEKIESLMHGNLLGQISRFMIIGVAASVVHVATASSFFYGMGTLPLSANFIGFLAAWILSFVGHYFWTFDKASTMRLAMPRFFLVSVLGLGLNQVIVWLVVNQLGKSFALAMIIVVLVIPATSFVLSKLWAFRAEN